MYVHFSKMHGLGNDFMVLDLISQPLQLSKEQIKRLADRHFGVGFDQLLIVEPPYQPDIDFHYRIFNADGGEVEQCGNGARCFAKFVREAGLTAKNKLRVSTKSGTIELVVEPNGLVTVDMGAPNFAPASLPFLADIEANHYSLDVNGKALDVGAISMGNPHCILLVDNIETAPVNEVGPAICHHPHFPNQVNVGFLQVVDRRYARLRVYERGSAETLACGTGACAAMVAGRRWGMLDRRAKIRLPGGHLFIRWDGEGHSVKMTGPAITVFEGQIQL